VTWNFDYLEQCETRRLTQGRMFVGPARNDCPTLLLVHGGFHGAWCWAPFLDFLSQSGVPAAAIDFCGHGGQSPPADFLTRGVKHMASDIVEAAEALGGKIVLAGHSLGALAVMAAAHKIAPRGMVLLAPAPPGNLGDIRLLPPFPEDAVVLPPTAERARKWFLGGYDGADIAPYTSRLCAESPVFLNDLYKRKITVDPAWVKGPSLCLSGGKDDSALHRGGQDDVIASFYGAELVNLPEASHCMMLDDSYEFTAAAVLAWLQRHGLAVPP